MQRLWIVGVWTRYFVNKSFMQHLHIVGAWDRHFHDMSFMQQSVCELVTSKNQIKQDKSTPTFQLVVASVSNNNASYFDDMPSSTFQSVVASVNWKSKAVSNKPFRTLRLNRIKSKMPFTFQLIVGSKQVHQRKPQRFLVDAWLSNTISEHVPNSHESTTDQLDISVNIWLNGMFEVPILSAHPTDEYASAIWLHISSILGLVALGEAADAMAGLCFVCIYRTLT